MAQFRTVTRVFDEPNQGVTIPYLIEQREALGAPEDASVDCDHGMWCFWWMEQLTEEEEEETRLREVAKQAALEVEEAADRRAGF